MREKFLCMKIKQKNEREKHCVTVEDFKIQFIFVVIKSLCPKIIFINNVWEAKNL